MADKEFVLGQKGRELLHYTKHATRIVTDDVSVRDVRALISRIAALDDISRVREVSSDIIHKIDEKKREGFTKSQFRLYGEDIQTIAKNIVRDIQAANNVHFAEDYEKRLSKIDEILDGWRRSSPSLNRACGPPRSWT